MASAGSLLQKESKDLGPVEVEENARTVFTAASNLLDASNVTSRPFVDEGNLVVLPGNFFFSWFSTAFPMFWISFLKYILFCQLSPVA